MMAVTRYCTAILVLVALALTATISMAQPATPDDPARPLTIEEAVQFALRNNPAVKVAEEDLAIAESQVSVARAGKSPKVDFGLAGQWDPTPTSIALPGSEDADPIEIGAGFSASAQFSATRTMWPKTIWQAPIDSARAGMGLAQENLYRVRQQTAFQTRRACYQLATARELVLVAEDAVNVSRRQVELANSTFKAGLNPKLDVYQAEAVLAQTEVELFRAQNGVDIARSALAIQLGLPADAPVDIVAPKTLPEPPADLETLIKQAVSRRPELAQLQYRRAVLQANLELIKTQKLPVVSLQGNFGETLVGGSLFGQEGFTLGAAVSFNLFDGGKTNAQVEGVEQQLRQIDTALRQLELSISFEVRQAWLDQQNARRQLAAAQRQYDAAQEAFRISQVRYDAGEGIILEVDQARLNRTQALNSLAQARLQAQTAAAQLDLATGMPVDAPTD